MDPKTARKYLRERPAAQRTRNPRSDWRTRPDPFAEVWEEIREQVGREPGSGGQDAVRGAATEVPRRVRRRPVRTLQRRIKLWRATEGPGREVFFAQKHVPGRLCAVRLHAHDASWESRSAGRAFRTCCITSC